MRSLRSVLARAATGSRSRWRPTTASATCPRCSRAWRRRHGSRTSWWCETTGRPTAPSTSSTTSPPVRRSPCSVLPSGGRLGYAQNFVAASRACTGDLLFFADQDDSWRPEKLETVARARAAAATSRAVSHDFTLRTPTGRRSPRRTPTCWPSGASARWWRSRAAASRSPAASSTRGAGRRRRPDGVPRLLGDAARHRVRPARGSSPTSSSTTGSTTGTRRGGSRTTTRASSPGPATRRRTSTCSSTWW